MVSGGLDYIVLVLEQPSSKITKDINLLIKGRPTITKLKHFHEMLLSCNSLISRKIKQEVRLKVDRHLIKTKR